MLVNCFANIVMQFQLHFKEFNIYKHVDTWDERHNGI